MSIESPYRLWMFSLILPLLFAAASWRETTIETVSGVRPKASAFRPQGWKTPLVIGSDEDAAKHFADDNLARVKEHVDFEKQIVLLFAWRGSGQDRLSVSVAESQPVQIQFTYRPGRTRDLRPHAYVFVLPSDAKWSVK